MLVLNMFYGPLNLAFDFRNRGDYSRFNELFMEAIPNFAFVIEIILKFNTAFY